MCCSELHSTCLGCWEFSSFFQPIRCHTITELGAHGPCMHCYKERIDHSPAVHSPSSNQDQRAVQKCSSGTLHKLNPAKPASNCQVHQGLHCLASPITCNRIKQKNFRTKIAKLTPCRNQDTFWQASASSSWLRFLWATSVEKVVWAKASANATQSSTHCILET